MDEAGESIQLLGPMTIHIAGNRISQFRSKKTMALLAYLVVEDRFLARDYLAEMFWPDATSAVSRGNLRRALYDLAHKLPDWIVFDRDIVAFNKEAPIIVDLCRFDSLRTSDDSILLEKAMELSRGEFLEGISLTDCPQFEHWLWSEREQWRQKAVSVIEKLCGRYSQASQNDQALDCGWRLVKLQPWREDRYRSLMVLLVRRGDIATAVKIYARCRRVLASELEMEPGPETLALHNRIRKLLAQTPANVTADTLPRRPWTRELGPLVGEITGPGHRLITITGPEYSGRASLANSVAFRVNGRPGYFFIDGVFQIHLENVLKAEETVAELGHGLRISTARKVIPQSFVLKYLRDKELLLVLTDLAVTSEHREMLASILNSAPGVKIIVTASDAFRLPDEYVIALHHPGSSDSGEVPAAPDDEENDLHEYLGLFI